MVKFVTERFEFVGMNDAQRMLTENQDFIVVSVIGAQGAGKSSLLNEIVNAFAPPKMDLARRPDLAARPDLAGRVEPLAPSLGWFTPNVLQGAHAGMHPCG